MVGRRVLAPLTQVRILVPQPETIKGLTELIRKPFLFVIDFQTMFLARIEGASLSKAYS